MPRSSRRSFAERRAQHTENMKHGNNFSLLNLPAGAETFLPTKKEVIRLRIVPYIVTNKNHPDAIFSGSDVPVDDLWLSRPYGIHKFIAGSKKSVICPQYTFGNPCPICDEIDRLKRLDYDNTKEKRGAIKVTHMCVYNVMIGNDPTIRIFDWNYSKFAEVLDAKVNALSQIPEKRDVINFACLQGGKYLDAVFVEKVFTKPYIALGEVDFSDAPDLPDDTSDKAYKLDEFFNVKSYEDIKELLDELISGDTSPEVHKMSYDKMNENYKKSLEESTKKVEIVEEEEIPTGKKPENRASRSKEPEAKIVEPVEESGGSSSESSDDGDWDNDDW